jgi:hypothetical protein
VPRAYENRGHLLEMCGVPHGIAMVMVPRGWLLCDGPRLFVSTAHPGGL